MFKRKRLTLHWKGEKTIVIDEFPFKQPVQLTLPQKVVQKVDIAKHGLVRAYENTQPNTCKLLSGLHQLSVNRGLVQTFD